jgi:hypothetical protein
MKTGDLVGALIVLSMTSLTGCVSSEGHAGSCQVPGAISACIDFIGSSYDAAAGQTACSSLGGSYSSSSCAPGTLGTCVYHPGTFTETKWTYTSSGDGDAGIPDGGTNPYQVACTMGGGTYTP